MSFPFSSSISAAAIVAFGSLALATTIAESAVIFAFLRRPGLFSSTFTLWAINTGAPATSANNVIQTIVCFLTVPPVGKNGCGKRA